MQFFVTLGIFINTRIMINKGMANKGKYWILEKIRVYQYPFERFLRVFFQIEYSNFEGYKGINKGKLVLNRKDFIHLDQLVSPC